jgi:hypothetical protein
LRSSVKTSMSRGEERRGEERKNKGEKERKRERVL